MSVTKSNTLHMKIFVMKSDVGETAIVVAATPEAAIARVKQRTQKIYMAAEVHPINTVVTI